MGLINEKSAIVMQRRRIYDSIDIATSTFANRVNLTQQNCSIYHDINNCSRSCHAYAKYYLRFSSKTTTHERADLWKWEVKMGIVKTSR